MQHPHGPTQEQPLNIGDRVHFQQHRSPLVGLVDQVGTVVAIFRVPRDSHLLRGDGDTARGHELLFYRVEVAHTTA